MTFEKKSPIKMVWWVNPANFLLYITLPAFLLSSFYSEEVMQVYEIANFIKFETIAYGVLSLIFMIVGIKVGEAIYAGKSPNSNYNAERYIKAAYFLAIVSAVSHLVLIGNILANYNLILSALAGSVGAIYQVKANMTKISGVTSFTQLYVIALPLYAAYSYIFKLKPPKKLTIVIYLLLALIFIRAFVILERFAIVEAVLAYTVVLFAYRDRPVKFSGYYPLIGFFLIYALFAAGEYTRSWPYYRDQYDSFWEFTNIRLLGYIATATNNAAGVLDMFGTLDMPYYTAAWLRRLPLWDFVGNPFPDSPLEGFFNTYATAEFNNPGGILAGVIDYGYFLFPLYYLMAGVVSGILFYQFRRRGAFALVYFPGWYLGFPVLTQAIYWSDPRFFTVTVVAPFVASYITKKRV